MKLTKVEAGSMQEALRKIRSTLGDDALIVGTRSFRRGGPRLLRRGGLGRVKAAFAIWTAKWPTPPVAPLTSTDLPERSPHRRRPFRAARAATGSDVASTKESSGGMGRTRRASTRSSSAWAPGRRRYRGVAPYTASPGRRRDVPGPHLATTPAKSQPRTLGKRPPVPIRRSPRRIL